MNKILSLIAITLLCNTITLWAQSNHSIESIAHKNLIGKWTIASQRLDEMIIALSECEQQSHFIFTEDEIIENYYKMYNGNCVILNTNKDHYTVQDNRIIHQNEPDLNNTFSIKGEELTLSFIGKDEDNKEHIAIIICKKAKPIEYIK